MAFYAIRKKFRFKNSRSAPDGMVLRCYSRTCKWRVYAVLLKNTELYEVRRVELVHTCSVDDKSGYQTQATHTVIGEMMKARFSGTGGGPRPSEIMQVMQGDHDVHISYWKAWRSREVALETNVTTFRKLVASDFERCMEEGLTVTGQMFNIVMFVIYAPERLVAGLCNIRA
ncbi:hypothetical protein F2Q68_00013327 [Brassica cretica]|uniref:Transposase MuDR plant domain-containing protein n=1 Tax=Brassica cretica TaxID=69181 RepID=A0A8S9HB22_BRACR|nr:hypothetical protein F2Q68_00013327 [Brassica cretica]